MASKNDGEGFESKKNEAQIPRDEKDGKQQSPRFTLQAEAREAAENGVADMIRSSKENGKQPLWLTPHLLFQTVDESILDDAQEAATKCLKILNEIDQEKYLKYFSDEGDGNQKADELMANEELPRESQNSWLFQLVQKAQCEYEEATISFLREIPGLDKTYGKFIRKLMKRTEKRVRGFTRRAARDISRVASEASLPQDFLFDKLRRHSKVLDLVVQLFEKTRREYEGTMISFLRKIVPDKNYEKLIRKQMDTVEERFLEFTRQAVWFSCWDAIEASTKSKPQNEEGWNQKVDEISNNWNEYVSRGYAIEDEHETDEKRLGESGFCSSSNLQKEMEKGFNHPSKRRISHDTYKANAAKRPRTCFHPFKANVVSDIRHDIMRCAIMRHVQDATRYLQKVNVSFGAIITELKKHYEATPDEHRADSSVKASYASDGLLPKSDEVIVADTLVVMSGGKSILVESTSLGKSPIIDKIPGSSCNKFPSNKLKGISLGKTTEEATLPQLPQVAPEMVRIMERSPIPCLPFQKQLTKTDISSSLTIVMASAKQSVFPLLNNGEMEALKNGQAIRITIFHGNGNDPRSMQLRYIKQESKVFIPGGLRFLKDSEGRDLEENVHCLNSWPFRHPDTGILCFFFTVTKKSQKGKEVVHDD